MSTHHRDWDLRCKVYVGSLGSNASKHELEDAFMKYGTLKNVWVARNPPGFAFVEFEDPRDAEDAVRYLDGTWICGSRVRVEMSSGRTRNSGAAYGKRRASPYYGRYSRSRSRSWSRSRSDSRSPSRSRSRSQSYYKGRSYSRSRSPSPIRRRWSPRDRDSRSRSFSRSVSRSYSRSYSRSRSRDWY